MGMNPYLATWLKPTDYICLCFFPPKFNTNIHTNQVTITYNTSVIKNKPWYNYVLYIYIDLNKSNYITIFFGRGFRLRVSGKGHASKRLESSAGATPQCSMRTVTRLTDLNIPLNRIPNQLGDFLTNISFYLRDELT